MITFHVTSPGAFTAYGLSTEPKPTPASVSDCCVFTELDTGDFYVSQGLSWVKRNGSGGGGGGAEGTIPFTLSTGASGNFPLSGGGIQFTTQEGGVVTIPLG